MSPLRHILLGLLLGSLLTAAVAYLLHRSAADSLHESARARDAAWHEAVQSKEAQVAALRARIDSLEQAERPVEVRYITRTIERPYNDLLALHPDSLAAAADRVPLSLGTGADG